MPDIIDMNLKRMRSTERGGMRRLMMEESMGGNAGSWGPYACVATNFYYEKETGLLVTFGNVQSVDPLLAEGRAHGTFRIAMDFNPVVKGRGTRIVESLLDDRYSVANAVLRRCVDEYNERFGFRILSRTDEGFSFKALK